MNIADAQEARHLITSNFGLSSSSRFKVTSSHLKAHVIEYLEKKNKKTRNELIYRNSIGILPIFRKAQYK